MAMVHQSVVSTGHAKAYSSFKEALNKSTWIHDGDNGEIMKGFHGGNKAVSGRRACHERILEKTRKQSQARLVWIRVLGLPLQLWSNRGYKGDWVKIWRMVGDGAQESLEMGLN
ncbi:hypothetical protein H5410_036339 [Solanum commersonii]|uniref:Uncharacterized protein n=1 Tax=Solanum commersonii TaxID=4109 RepID=A0A9J5Y396_SOLCO|nr:hypothetical protein H5410_036339 [Solanum commersonii]